MKLSRRWLVCPIGIILGIAIFFLPHCIQTSEVFGSVDSQNVVILDAGHGGVDPGAIGVSGSNEKDINLAIALFAKDILKANGYTVVMTRESDISTCDEGTTGISKIKTSDIRNRLKLIEQYPDAIVILIHQNEFSIEKYSGAQMFYGKKNEKSKSLAQSLQAAFVENLQPQNERQIKPSTSAVYLLHRSPLPTVLAECGFMSNHAEEALLTTEEYQQRVAFTIFCGIEKYREEIEVLKNNSEME